jgi:hypothetical protein
MRRTLREIAHQKVSRQHYADGGFVQRVKQAVGLDPERNARIAEYRAQAEREKQAAAQAAAPVPPPAQPQSAISGYNGMSATERRMKELGLKDGGHVRGPGTGTSDSIPAMLSDGEFVMPADTVRKVGVRKLQDLVDKTHKPTGRAERATHFADGGSASYNEFEQQMAAQRAASRQRAVSGARAAAASAEEDAMADALGSSGVSQIPTGGLQAPAADGSQDRWSNTEVGRNLSNIATALPGSLGGAVPAIAKTGGAISAGLDAASRLMSAGAGAATVGALPGTVAAQREPVSAAGAGRGVVNPPAVNPMAPPPVSPAPSAPGADPSGTSPAAANDVKRVGNSYSGNNVAGDITINGQAPRGTGVISAQNMAAAENLAAGQGARTRLMSVGTGPVESGGFSGGFTGVVGSSSTQGNMRGRTPEQRLRDAEVSASSITNKPEWGGRGAENSAAMLEYRAALQQDSNIRQNQAGADLETTRQTGSLQREGLQQAGETQRTNIRAQRDDAANEIARGRLSLEQVAAGYTNRSADRMDKAQAELEAAKTPEAQRSARERLLALAGKAPQNEWAVQVTPTTKNLDGSTTQGSVYRFNKTTGETVRVDEGQAPAAPKVSSQAQFDALPKGATYMGADGRMYRKPA